MTTTTDRTLALDLLDLTLDDPDALARFVARHALAPARRAHDLPDPRPDERDDFLFEPLIRRDDGVLERRMRPMHLAHPAAYFEPLLRGLLLFGYLFPEATWHPERPEPLIEHPGVGFDGAALKLAMRPYAELEALSRAIMGLPTSPPTYHGLMAFRPLPNPAALQALSGARELVGRALGPFWEDPDDYQRLDVGLQAMDQEVAAEIDEILRAEVHQRLIWLANFEEADPDDPSSSSWITIDQGVFSARVPESLRGLVVLELVEAFGRGQRVARCGQCGEPVALSRQRAARARKGDAVYHDACEREHRLAYFREYQALRRAN